MTIFVPSWTHDKNSWLSPELPWYYVRQRYQFDETVCQLRMFSDVGEPASILCLHYMPTLRRFLHREALYPFACYSVFDAMQKVQVGQIGLFSFRDLVWPEDASFVYGLYEVTVICDGKPFAIIEFGSDGTMTEVRYYGGIDSISHIFYFDDRGFLSSALIYDEGQQSLHCFFSFDGQLRFTLNCQTGRVQIASGAEPDFRQKEYESLDAIIEEYLASFLSGRPSEDLLVLAADGHTEQMVLRVAGERRYALSLFGKRFDERQGEMLRALASRADFVLTDTERSADRVRAICAPHTKVRDMTPFDTRLHLGESQRIAERRLLLPVDFLGEEDMKQILELAFKGLERHPEAVLLIASQEEKSSVLAQKLVFCPEALSERVRFVFYHSENELTSLLRETRLILDLREDSDLYLQIAGLSMGIPQVVCTGTHYVLHKKTGYILSTPEELGQALDYYLSDLSHWNEALVCCVKEIRRYREENIVELWRKLMAGGSLHG